MLYFIQHLMIRADFMSKMLYFGQDFTSYWALELLTSFTGGRLFSCLWTA